jgi:hypothetical protein
MSRKNDIQPYHELASHPMVMEYGQDTKELQNIENQTQEAIARITGKAQKIRAAVISLACVHEIADGEYLQLAHKATAIVNGAQTTAFTDEVVRHTYTGMQRLSENFQALESAGAERMYLDIQSKYQPRKLRWFEK